jgi:hypothetical protein
MMPFYQSQHTMKMDRGRVVTYRIVEILNLLHQLDHGFTFAVSNVWLLRYSQAVLGTDAAIPLLDPLIHKGLQLLLHGLVKFSDWDVEVQIRIAHVAISNNVNDRVRGIVAKQASLCQAIACFIDQIVKLSDGY